MNPVESFVFVAIFHIFSICGFLLKPAIFFSFAPAIEKITIAIGRRIQESENTTEQMSDFFYG